VDLRRITFLRFVAAFAVVVFHFGRDCPSLAWGSSLWAVANSTTTFFFLLSGFILACVYGQRADWTHTAFYVARCARILPLYLLATLPAATWLWWHGGIQWPEFALVTLLLQAWVPGYSVSVVNPPGWSLSVEVFFYLLFPFALAATMRIGSSAVLIAGMVVVWAANQCLHALLLQLARTREFGPWLWDAVNFHPLGHLATFVAGMLGGLLYLRHGERCRRVAPLLVGAGLAALVALAASCPPLLAYRHNGLFAPLFYLIVLGVAAGDARWFGVLAIRPLQLLGEISYGVYILQVPVNYGCTMLAAELGWPITGDAFFWPFGGLLVLLSWVSHRVFESPLRALINSLGRRPRGAASPSPARQTTASP
jgi:peptidoglycan/LPS O-acetylase OafA/YrhL